MTIPRSAAAVTLAVALAAGTSTVLTPPASAAVGTDVLQEGESLVLGREGDRLVSPSGQFVLEWDQAEGVVFVAESFGSTYVTALGSGEVGDDSERLVLQDDGNLVIYTTAGVPVWASGTSSSEPVRLVLQDDANLVLYTASGRPLWATGDVADRMLAYTFTESGLVGPTVLRVGHYLLSADRRYRLVMQWDGNVVLYDDRAGRPIWATGTRGGQYSTFVVQTDGNVVVYDGTRPVWATGTARRVGQLDAFELALQTDGNVVLYAYDEDHEDGRAVWASGTRRR